MDTPSIGAEIGPQLSHNGIYGACRLNITSHNFSISLSKRTQGVLQISIYTRLLDTVIHVISFSISLSKRTQGILQISVCTRLLDTVIHVISFSISHDSYQ